MKSLFIVGTQGVPARYGGLETFAEELATRLAGKGYEVYVTCERSDDAPDGPEEYNGVHLLYVTVPLNNMRTFVGDRTALQMCLDFAKPGDVVYLQGYGAGPFVWGPIRRLRRGGIRFWLNPDGLEWKRPRWPWFVRRYLKFCEGSLIKRADRIVCDAAAIRDHHEKVYGIQRDRMSVIEYGAPLVESVEDSAVLQRMKEFLGHYDLAEGEYYVYVGRFVPDNNLELMIRGVLDERVSRRLLIFAPHQSNDPFFKRMSCLVRSTGNTDKVIFTGGVYDKSLLQSLRLSQFAYFHGHEVGGTNPALVEAMGLGSFVIALDTPFNREVLQGNAIYFQKDVESFVTALINADGLPPEQVLNFRAGVQQRVRQYYNWTRIADEYDHLLHT